MSETKIERAREFVMLNLPSTSMSLCFSGERIGIPWRSIDSALQSLRRRGEISFSKGKKQPIWFKLSKELKAS